jgi:hypothetical protein
MLARREGRRLVQEAQTLPHSASAWLGRQRLCTRDANATLGGAARTHLCPARSAIMVFTRLLRAMLFATAARRIRPQQPKAARISSNASVFLVHLAQPPGRRVTSVLLWSTSLISGRQGACRAQTSRRRPPLEEPWKLQSVSACPDTLALPAASAKRAGKASTRTGARGQAIVACAPSERRRFSMPASTF